MIQLNVMREELEQTQMVTEKIRDELAELRLLERKDPSVIAESKEMRQERYNPLDDSCQSMP